MPWRYSGSIVSILEKERKQAESRKKRQFEEEIPSSEEEEEEEEEELIQTFPDNEKMIVQRQSNNDLLCGLKCLQNMYGPHITNREEMDTIAQQLQSESGYEMYNKELGFYDIQVLQTTLQQRGKWVQRVDIQKITPDYYLKAIEMNPTFSGYIVTMGTELKHYVAIRFSGRYKKIDSLPGVEPCYIEQENLFRTRSNGHVYCSESCSAPVVSLHAVGNSPFVEYNLLHGAWREQLPAADVMHQAISNAINYSCQRKKIPRGPVSRFFDRWQNVRIEPDETVYEFLNSSVLDQLVLEKDMHIHFGSQQTVIRCKTLSQLLDELNRMQWITADGYTLEQEGIAVFNSETPKYNSIDWSKAIHIGKAQHPQIGGFYTFKSSVQGTCTEKASNTYSVRDQEGCLHVIYKKTVENVISKS